MKLNVEEYNAWQNLILVLARDWLPLQFHLDSGDVKASYSFLFSPVFLHV